VNTASFLLPGLSEVNFSITRITLDSNSPLNQNQSHIHSECEIYLNLSGNVAFEVEKHIYPISRGSVIITRPYEYHHCIYRSAGSHDHYWITFSAGENQELLKLFFRREKGADNLLILGEAELTRMCGILDALLEGSDQLQRQIDFLRLVQLLNSCKRASHTEYMQKMPRDVAAALQYMEDHLGDDLDMPTLAEVSGVSINSLERHFRRELGTTPHAMLRRMRLLDSMKYLREGKTVSEAALKSGFTDYSGYIQMFRREFGMTPRYYKEAYMLK